jgi:predicted HTH transcriptional regulator
MCGFANRNNSQVGSVAKIIFGVSAVKHPVGANDATGNGICNVQRFQRSKENLPRE